MRHIISRVTRLSRIRQVILAAAFVVFLAVFMPWNMIGTAELSSEHSYAGFDDQNFILGALTAICSFGVIFLLGTPLLGLRQLRLPWREAVVVTFLGFQSALLTFIALIQHSTSRSLHANDAIQLGLYLAFLGSLVLFFGGNFLQKESALHEAAPIQPLTSTPHHRIEQTPERSGQFQQPTSSTSASEDRRMKLDI